MCATMAFVGKKKATKVASVRCSEETRHRTKVYAAKIKTTSQAVVDAALGEYLKKRGA